MGSGCFLSGTLREDRAPAGCSHAGALSLAPCQLGTGDAGCCPWGTSAAAGQGLATDGGCW